MLKAERIERLLLRKLGVGMLALLNALSKRRYGVSFTSLLLADAEKALELVMEVRGPTLARYMERVILPELEAIVGEEACDA